MEFASALELFEALLSGHELTAAELDDLLVRQISEGFHLEYKRGDELKGGNKGARTIREYASAFANSLGGVLIIGVDEKTWSVTGCEAPGGIDVAAWAADCLRDIAYFFSPFPRTQTVKHRDGDVLVVTTDRTQSLVPALEGNRLNYYLRFNDKTLKAPDYLVSDLLLGRRQRPHIHLSIVRVDGGIARPRDRRDRSWTNLFVSPVFELENESFTPANDIRIGLVAFIKLPGSTAHYQVPVGRHLQSHIDTIAPSSVGYSGPQILYHYMTDPFKVESFRVERQGFGSVGLPLQESFFWMNFVWEAAVYVILQEGPPIWYQLSILVNSELADAIDKGSNEIPNEFINMRRLVDERPVVGWSNFTMKNYSGTNTILDSTD